MYSGKKAQHDFPKMRGGDQRPFGTFPKIHPFWKRRPSLSLNTDITRDTGTSKNFSQPCVAADTDQIFRRSFFHTILQTKLR